MPNPAEFGQTRAVIMPATVITAPVALTTVGVVLQGVGGAKWLVAIAKFLVGTGGTTAKVYLQTSVDGGTTWFDIASFAFANTPGNRISTVLLLASPIVNATPTDGALADNTTLNVLGDRFRAKYVTTGTYSGGTSLELDILVRG